MFQIWISRDSWGWKYGFSDSWESYWVIPSQYLRFTAQWKSDGTVDLFILFQVDHQISLGGTSLDPPAAPGLSQRSVHRGFPSPPFAPEVSEEQDLWETSAYPRGHRTAEILAAGYSFSRKQHGSATMFLPQWLRWRLNCQVLSLLVEILKFAALICSFLGCKSLGFRIIFEWQKKGRNWRKNIAKPCWLVVLSILKHMSSSVGMIIPNIWKAIKFMFQTTNQNMMSQPWVNSEWESEPEIVLIYILTYHRHPTRPPRTPHGMCSLWVLGSKLGFHHDIILDTKHLVFPESWGYPKRALDGLFHGKSIYKWMIWGYPISGNLHNMTLGARNTWWFSQSYSAKLCCTLRKNHQLQGRIEKNKQWAG